MIEEVLNNILSEMKKLNAAFGTVIAVDQNTNRQATSGVIAPAPPAPARPTDPFGNTAILGQSAAPASQPPAPAPITREQCGGALVGLATEKGRDIAMAVLAQFNAKTLGEVKTEQYADLAAAIKQASNL